jgi:hypothetical protein
LKFQRTKFGFVEITVPVKQPFSFTGFNPTFNWEYTKQWYFSKLVKTGNLLQLLLLTKAFDYLTPEEYLFHWRFTRSKQG